MESGTIEFDHVSFRYNPDDQDVLHDVSFKVNRDETVAMV
jgi:subfamily B ATP-binding cassette protein MsbA